MYAPRQHATRDAVEVVLRLGVVVELKPLGSFVRLWVFTRESGKTGEEIAAGGTEFMRPACTSGSVISFRTTSGTTESVQLCKT